MLQSALSFYLVIGLRPVATAVGVRLTEPVGSKKNLDELKILLVHDAPVSTSNDDLAVNQPGTPEGSASILAFRLAHYVQPPSPFEGGRQFPLATRMTTHRARHIRRNAPRHARCSGAMCILGCCVGSQCLPGG